MQIVLGLLQKAGMQLHPFSMENVFSSVRP